VQDRSALWNAVEQSEARVNSQVAREVRVALPSELTLEQNRDLVCAFVQDQFVGRGMIADIALHAPGREGDQRNHHAHIMLTTREIGPEGFGAKNRDWNAKDLLLEWREAWAEHVNATLDRHSIHERVDHRTLVAQREDALSRANEAEERGDDRARADHMAQAMELDRPALPQIGASAWSMMRRGLVTPAAEQWREAREIGIQVRDLALEFRSAAVEWLDRLVERLQGRPALAGLAKASSGPQTPLERLQAARSMGSAAPSPLTPLERLQAAREGRTSATAAEVTRNVEQATRALQQKDAEQERQLEKQKAADRKRSAARERDDGYER
jgi:hypothetical protein